MPLNSMSLKSWFKILKHGLLISMLLFGLSDTSYARFPEKELLPVRKGVREGPMTVHVALETDIQFDSNIYLTEDDEKVDIITMLSPTFDMELELGESSVKLGYDMDIYIFGKHSGENHVDHNARARLELNLTDYKISISNEYRNFSHRAGSEDTSRIRQQNNNLVFGVSADFDQLAFDVAYTLGIEDYLSDTNIFGLMTYDDKDRWRNSVRGQASYRFLPKTSVLFDTSLGVINYDSSLSSDSIYVETLFGLKGEPLDDVTINIKGGLRYQNYDDSDLTASTDFTSFVAIGEVIYLFTDDDIVNFKAERSIRESTYDDMNYYSVNFVGLDYVHNFNRRLSGRIFGSYQLNLYPSETTVGTVRAKRYDHFLVGGCAVKYAIHKWVFVEAKYEVIKRDSRFSTFDYLDNLVTLRGTFGF